MPDARVRRNDPGSKRNGSVQSTTPLSSFKEREEDETGAPARGAGKTKQKQPLANDPGSNRKKVGGIGKKGSVEGVAGVWAAYREFHPRAKEAPSSGWVKLLRRRLKEFSEEELVLLVRWAHKSDDYAFQRSGGYINLDNILREEKVPGRLEQAKAWEAGARSVASLPSFRSMSPVDRNEMLTWSSERQARWARLVSGGEGGAAAMLMVENGSDASPVV